MKKFIPFSRIVILSALWITPAYAASTITDVKGIIKVLDNIAGYVAQAFWIAASIGVFYAAFLYLTAGDSEEKVTKAHKYFLYAVIAIAVALFAYGMPKLVESILTPGNSPSAGFEH